MGKKWFWFTSLNCSTTLLSVRELLNLWKYFSTYTYRTFSAKRTRRKSIDGKPIVVIRVTFIKSSSRPYCYVRPSCNFLCVPISAASRRDLAIITKHHVKVCWNVCNTLSITDQMSDNTMFRCHALSRLTRGGGARSFPVELHILRSEFNAKIIYSNSDVNRD